MATGMESDSTEMGGAVGGCVLAGVVDMKQEQLSRVAGLDIVTARVLIILADNAALVKGMPRAG